MNSRVAVGGMILAACLSLALLMWLKATKAKPTSRGIATAPAPGGISPKLLETGPTASPAPTPTGPSDPP